MKAPTHVVVNTSNGEVYPCPSGSREPFSSVEEAQGTADEYNARVGEQYRTHAVYSLELVTLAPADVAAYTVESVVAGSREHKVAGLAEANATLTTLQRNLHVLQPGESITIIRLPGE